jgi:Mce-associated membrane protein
MTPVNTDSEVEDTDAPALSLDASTTRRAWQGLAAVLALAAIIGGLLVWAPWEGTRDLTREQARHMSARDEAVAAASAGLVALNTIDHGQMERTIDTWLGLTAGALRRDLTRDRARITKRAAKAGSDSSAETLQTAVAAFDPGAGTATILGVVSIRTTSAKGKTTTNVSRFRVLVQRLDSTWKLTYFEGVRVAS